MRKLNLPGSPIPESGLRRYGKSDRYAWGQSASYLLHPTGQLFQVFCMGESYLAADRGSAPTKNRFPVLYKPPTVIFFIHLNTGL